MQNQMTENLFDESDIISTYTAEQAEEDGYLINVTEIAKEAGFKWPVRITNRVWEMCNPPKSNKIESYEGRLWDVLYMAFIKIRTLSRFSSSPESYVVRIGRKNVTLWITIDGTMGHPAIHIITPEDY